MNALFDPQQPLAWLIGCLALAVATTNAAWLVLLRSKLTSRHAATLPALTWLVVSLFWLLPPLLAWRAGALSLSFLGVAEIDWVQSLADGLPLAAAGIGLVLFGWLIHRRALLQPAAEAAGPSDRIGRTARALLDAVLLGWHWAFYRAAAIGWLAALPEATIGQPVLAHAAGQITAQPLYWGSWFGLACVGLEWALNPFARAELRAPGRQEAALRRIVLALTSTGVFIVGRNLWLCLAAQVIIETAIAGWFPAPMRAPGPE